MRGTVPAVERRSGFTVLELLVVLALIVFLMARLMPVLQDVRIRAQNTKCINNLGQIGRAYKLYDTDWRRLPPTQNQMDKPGRPNGYDLTWVMCDSNGAQGGGINTAPHEGALFKYISAAPEVILCPLDTKGNGKFSYSQFMVTGLKQLAIAQNPARDPLMLQEDAASLAAFPNGTFFSTDLPDTIHQGLTGTLFLDAHVEMKDWTQYPGTSFAPRVVGTLPTAGEIYVEPWGYSTTSSTTYSTDPQNRPD